VADKPKIYEENPSTAAASTASMRRSDSPEQFPDGRACFRELMSHVNLFAVMFNSSSEITYCNGRDLLTCDGERHWAR
jgi:hypothetical protein